MQNQMCIGIACDGRNVYCRYEGYAKPTKTSTLDAFGTHIERGSRLIHDKERAHSVLIEELALESVSYDSKEIKQLPDAENPLNDINQKCRLLQSFLKSHSGFIREDIQGYLDLFTFMMNPPGDKHEKVENS